MKCTVLGATGFIGSNLASRLRTDGHDVYVPTRDDLSIFNRPLGHVFYCIGLTADFRTRPYEAVRAHIGLLGDLLERADFDSLVYLSSTRVYLHTLRSAEQDSLVVTPNEPADLYNLSKLTGESLCWNSKRHGVKAVRVSNVVGSDTRSENFLYSLIRSAISGKIVLHTALESSKDYVLLDDVVGLLPRIAIDGKHSLYNLASGVNLTNREITSRLVALTGCSLEVVQGAMPQVFPVINVDRICDEFGFSAKPMIGYLDKLVGLPAI